MKDSRTYPRRLAAFALLALAATSTFAQGPGGFGGPPPGMGGGPGGRRGGSPRLDRLPPLTMLALRPEVVEELGLSDAQTTSLWSIAESMRPQGGPRQGGRQNGPPPEGDRERAEAAADAKVTAVLSEAQAKRLEEIQIQAMGLSAAMVPQVQTSLALTAAQKAKLNALVPSRGQRGPGGPPPDGEGGGPGGGFGGPPPEGGPGRGGDMRKALETKIAAILTTEQLATLKALGGKPIALRDGGPDGPPPRR